MGQLVLIIGPTAVGKTQLEAELLKRIPNSGRVISTTSRKIRPGEKDGVDYFFISRADFEEGLRKGDFIEHAEVHGNLYGASRVILESTLEQHEVILAVIDIQGAETFKRIVPTMRSLFIRPGSMAELERRLRAERKESTDEEIRTRLTTAERELSVAHTFDHVIENIDGQFEVTVRQALAYIEECLKSRA